MLFVDDMLWMQNISLQLQGKQFTLGLLSLPIKSSQSKGRDIIFHLSEKKKKYAEEVTFTFKIFRLKNL